MKATRLACRKRTGCCDSTRHGLSPLPPTLRKSPLYRSPQDAESLATGRDCTAAEVAPPREPHCTRRAFGLGVEAGLGPGAGGLDGQEGTTACSEIRREAGAGP